MGDTMKDVKARDVKAKAEAKDVKEVPNAGLGEVLPKRLIILNAIKKGGATKESLMEVASVTAKSLASQFSYLRLMGHYPFKTETGVYELMSATDWLARKAEAKAKAKVRAPIDPIKKKAALVKKIDRLDIRVKADKNMIVTPGSKEDIQHQINKLTLKLFKLQLETIEVLTKKADEGDNKSVRANVKSK